MKSYEINKSCVIYTQKFEKNIPIPRARGRFMFPAFRLVRIIHKQEIFPREIKSFAINTEA